MNKVKIERLESFSEREFEQLCCLMGILSPGYELTVEALANAAKQAQLYVMRNVEGEIIGSATLAVFYSPTGRKASVEDVVVHTAYQGQGLGRILVEHLIAETNRLAPITLQLTSRPSRQAANHLYRSLEFEQRETNAYKMEID